MVLTTLPTAAPTRVPATPRKEAATAALRVARTLAMTWAALRLSPRLPLMNRPLCLVSPPLSQRGIHGRGDADVVQPHRAYARHLVRQVRSRPFAADRGPAGARSGVHVPSPGRSRSARGRRTGRPGPCT